MVLLEEIDTPKQTAPEPVKPESSAEPTVESQVKSSEDTTTAEPTKFSPEEEAKLLAESDSIKLEGNALFASLDFDGAIAKYNTALATCPAYLDKPVAVLHSNVSACHAKKQEWTECVEACTRALAKDSKYLKPLLRRAHANEQIASWSSLSAAQEDYKLAHEIAPTRETALALVRVGPLIEAAQKRETAEMMGKLKELGNGILKPFGLSTDMFKMQPDEKGGYSMSFSKN
ncbi:hypothetical protein V1512DRAFT_260504 [Lipomyces arxii]|uniref:uncharacterized protein n=1 Tax=Lipomyces arxii TaxID=56418 RepID=UPI0034CE34C7